jgi:hypothetical protein
MQLFRIPRKSFLLVGFLATVLIFFVILPACPRFVVMSDQLWRDLFLGRDGQLLSLKTLILKNRVLPVEHILDIKNPEETLSGEIAAQRAEIVLLSPLLSKIFLDMELWKKFPEKEFLLFSMTELFAEGNPQNVRILQPDPKELAGVLAPLLETEKAARGEAGQVFFFRAADSFFGQEEFEIFLEYTKELLPSLSLESADTVGIKTIPTGSLVVLFPGAGGDSLDVLQGLADRGGRAVVVGDLFARSAWPDTVIASVCPDVTKTLEEVLENRASNGRNQMDSILFSVSRGK